MKNVYILSTDEPSRLWVSKLGNLARCNNANPIKEVLGNNVNIYITADEPIKKDDWCLDTLNNILFISDGNLNLHRSTDKKVILTTDQHLIKDGIQPISDEFLEWFCSKNGQVDFVEVEKCHYEMKSEVNKQTGNYNFKCMNCKEVDYDLWFSSSPTLCFSCGYYNIVIPKEESLLDLDQIIAQKMFEVSDLVITIDNPRNTITLEEAAEIFYQKSLKDDLGLSFYDGVKFATEYQKQQMYTEEDLREAFRQGQENITYDEMYGYDSDITEDAFIERFNLHYKKNKL